MISFWVTIFVSVEIGIASAVAYSLVYLLLQLAFTRVILVNQESVNNFYHKDEGAVQLREDAMVFILQDLVLYPNAARISRQIREDIYTYSSPDEEQQSRIAKEGNDRLWNDTKQKLVASLREKVGFRLDSALPKLRLVVLDMSSRVTHIDTTGLQALADIRANLQDWAGPDAELGFLGMNEELRARFSRAQEKFNLKSKTGAPRDTGEVVFDVLHNALYESSGMADLEVPNQVSPPRSFIGA
jgi:solute carrier family 26 (sodium-independent sulfate anion transporter), member 11